MSNPNYTALLFILDASGSMAASVDGRRRTEVMEEALHKVLESQARKLAGYITVDVGYLEDKFTYGESMGDPFTINLSLYSRGGTDVYNSVHQALPQFKSRIDAMPEDEKPGQVVVVIMTDGQSSDNYNVGHNGTLSGMVRNLIKNEGWNFAFLAAERNALKRTIAGLGVPANCGIEEAFTAKGVEVMAEKLDNFISTARGGGQATLI